MPSGLFGSSPSVTTTPPQTYNTIQPSQLSVLNQLGPYLAQVLSSGQFNPPQGPSYGGQLAPGPSADQSSLIAQILSQVQGGGQVAGTGSASLDALNKLYNTTPTDFTNYYQTAVAGPLERNFQQRTLPSITSALARSSGGAYGSDASKNVDFATQDLLTQEGIDLSTLAYNSVNQANQTVLGALGQTPGLTGSVLSNLGSGLSAATLPTSYQSALDTASYQAFLNQIGQGQGSLSNMLSYIGMPNIQAGGQSVVNPGQTGLIPSLLASLGGNQGFGSAVGKYLFG